MNIWRKLPRPFFILAPMEDVTDTVFRRVIKSVGRPDLFFTEFTSCEGLIATKDSELVAHRLRFSEEETPIIAQIWGKTPEAYLKGAKVVSSLGFDGIDLNMGCPVKKIVKQGCCSALIKDQALASEIISATKEGSGGLPVSVKTRIGFDKLESVEWAGFLLDMDLDALTIHGRLAKDMSKGDVRWDEIKKIVNLRDQMCKDTVIVGNGDVLSLSQGREISRVFGVDGIMIGRGVFRDPWLFNPVESIQNKSKEDKLQLLSEHLLLFDEIWGDMKNYAIMKKFFKVYVRGFRGASELREELYKTESVKSALDLIKKDLE